MLSPNLYEFFKQRIPQYPGNYLEIGMYDGEGILSLATQYPDRKFFAVDPFIEDGYTTIHNGVPKGHVINKQRNEARQRAASVSNIKIYEMRSVDFYKLITPELVKELNVDFVLIDGAHNYEDATNDFQIASRLIQDKGIILIDDIGIPGVAMALSEFIASNKDHFLGCGEGWFYWSHESQG